MGKTNEQRCEQSYSEVKEVDLNWEVPEFKNLRWRDVKELPVGKRNSLAAIRETVYRSIKEAFEENGYILKDQGMEVFVLHIHKDKPMIKVHVQVLDILVPLEDPLGMNKGEFISPEGHAHIVMQKPDIAKWDSDCVWLLDDEGRERIAEY